MLLQAELGSGQMLGAEGWWAGALCDSLRESRTAAYPTGAQAWGCCRKPHAATKRSVLHHQADSTCTGPRLLSYGSWCEAVVSVECDECNE